MTTFGRLANPAFPRHSLPCGVWGAKVHTEDTASPGQTAKGQLRSLGGGGPVPAPGPALPAGKRPWPRRGGHRASPKAAPKVPHPAPRDTQSWSPSSPRRMPPLPPTPPRKRYPRRWGCGCSRGGVPHLLVPPPRPQGTQERRHRQPRRGPCYLQASPGPSPRPRRFSSPYLAPLDRLSNREPKRSRDKEKFTEDSETNRRPGPRFVLADLARPPLRADGAVTAFSGSNPPLELMNNQPGLLGRGAALMNNSSALRADSRVHPLPAS